MSVTSGAPSTRSMLTSLAIHGLALVLVLLVPAEALSRSPRPKTEVDVVFHRPPRIEVPAPAAPRPPSREATAARPSPVVPPKPSPPAPGEPGKPAAVAEAQPRQRVGNSGILAFRDQLASLAQDKKIAPRLGAEARYGAAKDVGQPSSPSTLTTNTPGSSGGINLASLSHSVGGGGGGGGEGGIPGVAVGRATSPIGGGGGGGGGGGVGGRPLARGGPGPSRTDEEIQIVFDRYKASFYRLYNRALRNDPTLKGQMVLRLTIEPDGSVSMCKLQSSDMNAPDLAAQVVNIVRTINFGAKDGVQALTIAYPIDFLPAA